MSTPAPLELRELEAGIHVPIRAQPGARREGVCGTHNGRLKVAVAAPPDKGKANDAIVRVMSDALGVKRSQLTIISGRTSREKMLLVEGTAPGAIRRRIDALLATLEGAGS